jgi:RsiW-degrading membrane proteinase PrsW (M82 family)
MKTRAAGASTGHAAVAVAAVLGSGALLFASAAFVERALGTPPWAAGIIEEAGKAILVAAFGLAALRSGGGDPARGLSLGLAASAVFAAIENCAYYLAFPEAGTLARLAWSLPVHLDAALLSALGAAPLLRRIGERRRERARSPSPGRASGGDPLPWLSRIALFATAVAAAAAIHALANFVLSKGPTGMILAAAPIIGFSALAVLAIAFIDTAYIGGFLHGTEQGR